MADISLTLDPITNKDSSNPATSPAASPAILPVSTSKEEAVRRMQAELKSSVDSRLVQDQAALNAAIKSAFAVYTGSERQIHSTLAEIDGLRARFSDISSWFTPMVSRWTGLSASLNKQLRQNEEFRDACLNKLLYLAGNGSARGKSYEEKVKIAASIGARLKRGETINSQIKDPEKSKGVLCYEAGCAALAEKKISQAEQLFLEAQVLLGAQKESHVRYLDQAAVKRLNQGINENREELEAVVRRCEALDSGARKVAYFTVVAAALLVAPIGMPIIGAVLGTGFLGTAVGGLLGAAVVSVLGGLVMHSTIAGADVYSGKRTAAEARGDIAKNTFLQLWDGVVNRGIGTAFQGAGIVFGGARGAVVNVFRRIIGDPVKAVAGKTLSPLVSGVSYPVRYLGNIVSYPFRGAYNLVVRNIQAVDAAGGAFTLQMGVKSYERYSEAMFLEKKFYEELVKANPDFKDIPKSELKRMLKEFREFNQLDDASIFYRSLTDASATALTSYLMVSIPRLMPLQKRGIQDMAAKVKEMEQRLIAARSSWNPAAPRASINASVKNLDAHIAENSRHVREIATAANLNIGKTVPLGSAVKGHTIEHELARINNMVNGAARGVGNMRLMPTVPMPKQIDRAIEATQALHKNLTGRIPSVVGTFTNEVLLKIGAPMALHYGMSKSLFNNDPNEDQNKRADGDKPGLFPGLGHYDPTRTGTYNLDDLMSGARSVFEGRMYAGKAFVAKPPPAIATSAAAPKTAAEMTANYSKLDRLKFGDGYAGAYRSTSTAFRKAGDKLIELPGAAPTFASSGLKKAVFDGAKSAGAVATAIGVARYGDEIGKKVTGNQNFSMWGSLTSTVGKLTGGALDTFNGSFRDLLLRFSRMFGDDQFSAIDRTAYEASKNKRVTEVLEEESERKKALEGKIGLDARKRDKALQSTGIARIFLTEEQRRKAELEAMKLPNA